LLWGRFSRISECENRFHICAGGYSIPKSLSSATRGLPPNYRTVLEVVEEAGPGSHLTAKAIWLRARALQPRIGFATVHRGLLRLHELGAVMKIDVPGEASAVFEPAASPHAHFRCTGCGAITDLAYAIPARTVRRLAQRHGVAIELEAVTFTGRCANCG
jgi:Fur family transcriptional regulator, ferric uptake regulator